jgi:DNA polymerase-3 subunit beta
MCIAFFNEWNTLKIKTTTSSIMKFSLEKSTFIRLLTGVCSVAGKKNSTNLVILQNIKIEARAGMLWLVGTDSDTYIKNFGPATIEEEGVTTVSAQLIYDIIKKLDDGKIIQCYYDIDAKILQISSGKSKFKLMCLDATGYPNFEDQQMQVEFSLKSDDLAMILDKARFSISDDLSRYYLTGLFLHTLQEMDGLKLTAVSTDGHRLTVIKLNHYTGDIPLDGVIIPKKALFEVRRMISLSQQQEVKISVSRVKIKFEWETSTIISKLIDGEFPDYSRVLPKENNQLLRVNRKDLVSIIDRVSTVTNDSHRGIKLLLSTNNLVLEANSNENGSATEEMVVDFNYINCIEIGFNSKFLLDIFNQMESETVQIYLRDNISAILLKGDADENRTFVLMPIRI